LLALLTLTPGCVINKLRAKNSLNEGVREFNKGKYEIAEEKFKFAMELSPELANAQLFYARALNARFDQALTEDLGLKAIEAYENIIKNNPSDHAALDKSLAFQANVYDQLSRSVDDKGELYKGKYRETLLRRGELPAASQKTKADVYYTLGVDYWDEGYKMHASYSSRKLPIPPEILEKMKPRIQKAHEYLNKTLAVDPLYADAFFYEKLVFLDEIKVETNPARKKDLEADALRMQDKYLQIQKQKQQQAS
jgi:tetratricopeptide (TPR) repeat protein